MMSSSELLTAIDKTMAFIQSHDSTSADNTPCAATSEEEESKCTDKDVQNIYYGFNPVYFKQCTGKTFTLNDKIHSFKPQTEDDAIQIVKDRRLPQKKLGDEYSHLLLPSMPCVDINIDIANEEKDNQEKCNTIMESPLIKTEATDPSINASIIAAYQSGIRSALVCIKDDVNGKHTWYRLKGCGNNDDGYFPFECIDNGHSPYVQIRGCCFEHTTFRELKMTCDIATVLHKYHVPSANEAYGWYQYDMDKYCKKVIRTCTVFKTLGNKRLGDHLLFGLIKILPIIVDLNAVSFENLLDLFPETRRINDENNKWKVMQTYLAVLCEIDVINLMQNDHIAIPLKKEISAIDIDAKRQKLWTYACEEYKQRMSDYDGDTKRLIIEIYWRLGYESGYIQNVMHKHGISWGTYSDALGTHCNAHCNNYVVLAYDECKRYDLCLAPLDFDMAFYEKEYLQQMDEQYAKYTFKELIEMERNGNRASLSGDPQISSGVHWDLEEDVSAQGHDFQWIHWALTDTLISSFDKAYHSKLDQKNKSIFSDWDQSKQKLMYAIFNLALIHTLNVVA
eukprot:107716_1